MRDKAKIREGKVIQTAVPKTVSGSNEQPDQDEDEWLIDKFVEATR